MKIVHINTYTVGGAANASLRLHEALLAIGIESKMIFLNNGSKKEIKNSDFILKNTSLSLSKRVINRIGKYFTPEYKNKRKTRGKKGDYEIITFPLTSYRIIEKHPWVKEADIINLHWVADFINYPTFFKNVNKPIVWTLHDMNPFQGIFHYKEDEIINEREFGDINSVCRTIKHKALLCGTNMTIVTPSYWLGGISSQSNILGRFPHKIIYNGINFNIFKSFNKSFARKVFDLPDDKIILLFISQRIDNRRKGFDLLLEALKQLPEFDQMAICTAGELNKDLGIKNVFFTGSIHDDRLMALLYSAADVFVLPSREDNLPNTMLEAMACGTPVISFSLGGMKDIIQNDYNGLLIEEVTSEALANGIMHFIEHQDNFEKEKIRQFAEDHFNLKLQAERYIELYNSILG